MKKMFHLFETEDYIYTPKIRAGSEWVENGEGVITEKLDGTSVRLTVRLGKIVRVERRRNPTREEKRPGIVIDPWYMDARTDDPQAKHILDAALNTDVTALPDGEYTAEAIGPFIQGNPLGLGYKVCVPHVLAPRYADSLRTYDSLRDKCIDGVYSLYSPGHIAEGFVFHHPDGRMVKLRFSTFSAKGFVYGL